MIFLSLYLEFFKIGFFAVGGGLATIPFFYPLAANTGWFTPADILNMLAISQITPGPIGVNMATFTGYRAAGLPGAITAVIGLVSPAVLVIVIVANMMNKFMRNKYVISAFKGILAAGCAMISVAILKIMQTALINTALYEDTQNPFDFIKIKAIIFFIILFIAIRRLKWHPFIYVCISAALGLLIKF